MKKEVINLYYDEINKEVFFINKEKNIKKKLFIDWKNQNGKYPVISIKDINSIGREWIALSLIKNGENIIELEERIKRNFSNNSKIERYNLSDYLYKEEREEVENIKVQIEVLNLRLNELRNLALSRKSKYESINPFELSLEERKEKFEELKKIWGIE